MSAWDPERTAEFYDEYGEQEWTRFEDGRTPAAGYDIHVRFLERFVQPGQHVLDAGSGPGRFTLELVRLGADAVAVDISPVQLEQLRERLPDIETHVGDITDLSRFGDDSFDTTVCFGGPLSYVVDRGEDALAELVRVTRPGGHVLVSVMSLVGAIVHYISNLVEVGRRDGVEKQLEIVRTGFLPEEPNYGHLAMKLYRWSELEAMLGRRGEIVAAAASGLIPDPRPEEPELRAMIHALEVELCEDPGAVSGGQHIVAALRVA
jgi:ubiquinone/menaquinone biosynthesis C-methylase UbiE